MAVATLHCTTNKIRVSTQIWFVIVVLKILLSFANCTRWIKLHVNRSIAYELIAGPLELFCGILAYGNQKPIKFACNWCCGAFSFYCYSVVGVRFLWCAIEEVVAKNFKLATIKLLVPNSVCAQMVSNQWIVFEQKKKRKKNRCVLLCVTRPRCTCFPSSQDKWPKHVSWSEYFVFSGCDTEIANGCFLLSWSQQLQVFVFIVVVAVVAVVVVVVVDRPRLIKTYFIDLKRT